MGSFPETQNDPKIVVDLFFTITLTIFEDNFRSLDTVSPSPHNINWTKGGYMQTIIFVEVMWKNCAQERETHSRHHLSFSWSMRMLRSIIALDQSARDKSFVNFSLFRC